MQILSSCLFKGLIIIYFLYLFIADSFFDLSSKTYETITMNLGIFIYLIPIYLIFSILVSLLKDESKKIVFRTRLNFIPLLILILANYELIYLVSNGKIENEKIKIFNFLFYERNYGLITTMLLYKFYYSLELLYSYIITGSLLTFGFFIAFGKVVSNIVRKIKYYFSKEAREERRIKKEEVLKERRLKKEIEAKNKLQKKKEEKLKEEERRKKMETLKKIKEQTDFSSANEEKRRTLVLNEMRRNFSISEDIDNFKEIRQEMLEAFYQEEEVIWF